MAGQTYRVHGIGVSSDIPLPLAGDAHEGKSDIEVRRARSISVPDEPPPGEVYGILGEAPWRDWWTLDGETWRIRVAGRCELRIGPPWRTVEVDVDPNGEDDVIGDRALRTGVVFALERQGEHVLHASAVRVSGGTIALVGESGSGKSTLAALLCSDGAALISDDQLRVEFRDDGQVICHPGITTIRLRPPMEDLARLLGDGTRSWDGRATVAPAGAVGPQRLDALAFPVLSADAEAPRVTAMAPAEAMLALGRSRVTPRVSTWVNSRFHTNADVVERLPSFRVELPLGSVPDRQQRESLLGPLLAASP